jgi:hypothetical protein
VILANNATAVDAAGTLAVELGYRYLMQSARSSEGDVGGLARHLSGAIAQLLGQREVDCLISGGEPTVLLPEPAQRGIGGRNQQLALSIMESLREIGWPQNVGRFSLAVGPTVKTAPPLQPVLCLTPIHLKERSPLMYRLSITFYERTRIHFSNDVVD